MLRITQMGSDAATLLLEGQMVGPWVTEVRKACEKLIGAGQQLKINLSGVSFVDANGIALLSHFRSRGIDLQDCSPFLKEQLKGL